MLTLWRKWIAYPLGWLVLMVTALILVAVSAGARDTYPDMEAFHGRYEAFDEGTQVRMEVEEEVSVILNRERGIVRDLVTKYGDNFQNVKNFSVEDEYGQPVEFDEDRDTDTGDIELAIGGYKRVSGLHTYVIRYTITNAMVGNDDYQELYFNTNGTEWANGFETFSASLVLDESLAKRLTGENACYQGKGGSVQRCELSQRGGTYSVESGDGLGPWENVTLAVGFEPGTVSQPLAPLTARSLGWLGIGIMVGIGVLALGVALLARARVRDLSHGETGVVTQFTPPEGIEPVLAADFLGHPERGAAAHLAWLVLNGHGEITSSDERPGTPAAPGSDNLSASQRADLGQELRLRWHDAGMTPSMRRVTVLLFGSTDTYIPLAQHRRDSDLFRAQHFRDDALDGKRLRKDSALARWILWLPYLGLIGFGWNQIWAGLDGLGWWFLLGGVVAIMVLLYAVHITPAHGRLTKDGRELRRHLMGLERFVMASEANRISWLQNAATAPREDDHVHLYERLLPWAIVFGAERSWAQLVGDMYDRFPERVVPRFPALALAGQTWLEEDRTFYRRRAARSRRSPWFSTPDIGRGSLASGWSGTVSALSDLSSGRGSGNSSTRSSGRGWGGGSSSGRRRGGSSGRGSSGGGSGGGGGGRR